MEVQMTLRAMLPYRERVALGRPNFTPFSPLSREISRLLEEFSRGLGAVGALLPTAGLSPSTDVTETDTEIEIAAELPGLESQDVEISLEDDVLTIRGEKKMPADADDKSKNYHPTERSYGRFYRAFQLPVGIDPASVEATMSNGVLKIKIPKPAHTDAKKIEVKEAA
jgi:HSP20 family protein